MNLFDLCVYKNLNKGSGGDVDVSSLVATENKTYNAGEGKAYNPVVVNVPTPPPSLQSLTASHNGYFVPSSGYVGFSEVNVDVATPLETLNATENGTYTPSSGYDGFSEVTVDVPLPNNAYLLESQKDDVVTIQHGAEFDMPKLIASIEPQQSGSGDPSPENVRPISGRTACNVVRTGKNLAYTQTNNTVVAHAKKGVTYTLSFDGTNKGANLRKNTNAGDVVATGRNPLTFTADEDFDVFLNAWDSGFSNLQVEIGSSATSYEPYNGQTINIQFKDGDNPLTVYGGTLDVLSGVLTVDRAYKELSENWGWYQSTTYSGGFHVPCDSYSPQMKPSRPFMCSHGRTVTSTSEYVYGTVYCDYSSNFRLMPSGSSMQDWKDYIASERTNGRPIQICYELATPQTYNLTPTQVVKSLLGVNNIFADTGKVDVQIWTKEV